VQLRWPRDRRVATRLGFKRWRGRTCVEGGEEHGELWRPAQRDNNGTRGSSMMAERSARWSVSRRRYGNGKMRECTGSVTASTTGSGAMRDAGWRLAAGRVRRREAEAKVLGQQRRHTRLWTTGRLPTGAPGRPLTWVHMCGSCVRQHHGARWPHGFDTPTGGPRWRKRSQTSGPLQNSFPQRN
jgi:hypothetical protein